MQNIPTELLRAFITVIDLKGFTRAGERLGRSQPAISLQIKRLQDQIGCPLFDRENGGSNITEYGRLVESYARRILAINDELVAKIAARDVRGRMRLGVSAELADCILPRLLMQDWVRHQNLSFEVESATAPNLVAALKDGAFDLVFTISDVTQDPAINASWPEPMVWVGRPDSALTRNQPVRLVGLGEGCPYRTLMQTTLQQADQPYEFIYTGQCYSSVRAAWTSGFGITALPARAVHDPAMIIGKSWGLPALPDLRANLYLAQQMSSATAEPLAQRFLALLTDDYRKVA